MVVAYTRDRVGVNRKRIIIYSFVRDPREELGYQPLWGFRVPGFE